MTCFGITPYCVLGCFNILTRQNIIDKLPIYNMIDID